MTRYFANFLSLCLLLYGSNAFASEVFKCSLAPLNKVGWIPPALTVQMSDDHKTARVWASKGGGAVNAVLKQRGGNSYLLDWTLSRAAAAKSYNLGSDRYRVILNVDNLKVSFQVLTELAPGDQSPRGVGICAQVEELSN